MEFTIKIEGLLLEKLNNTPRVSVSRILKGAIACIEGQCECRGDIISENCSYFRDLLQDNEYILDSLYAAVKEAIMREKMKEKKKTLCKKETILPSE